MRGAASFLMALLFLLASCGSRREQMVLHLEELEQRNMADSLLTNDSLAEALVAWFDDYGTPNERLRSRYILARTYADLGEAPRALEAYLDAAACADTAAPDCDFAKLSRVYGQMSTIYYKQNLMGDYINCLRRAVDYAWIAKDTVQALNEQMHAVIGHLRLQRNDSAISCFEITFKQIHKTYGLKTASQYSALPAEALLKTGNVNKAKYYLDLYEMHSGYFDSLGNIEAGRESFYFYKGQYYLHTEQYDSALNCFQKEFRMGKDAVNQSMASRGLSLAYNEMGLPDSAAKYSIYSYAMNDSVYAQMATRDVEQMTALYNYSHHRNKAYTEHQKAMHEKQKNMALCFVLVFVLILFILVVRGMQRRKKMIHIKYLYKTERLEQVMTQLKAMHRQKEEYESLLKRSEENVNERLKCMTAHLSKQIQEKEDIVVQLQANLENIRNNKKEKLALSESKLKSSEYYRALQKRAIRCEELSGDDWHKIDTLVKDCLPDFNKFLSLTNYTPNSNEYKICVLLRLHVGMKDAGGMIGMSKSLVSRLCRDILIKQFMEDGSGKQLKNRLESIA